MSIYSRGHFSFLGFRLKRDRGHLSHLLWFLLPVNGRLRWAQEPAGSCRVSGASGVMPPPQVCQMGRSRPIQGAGGGAQVCQLGPVPLPALLTSPALRRPSRGSPGGNKRIKLPHKQIPQACGNNQRAMIVARTEGQRRRGPGVGSQARGPLRRNSAASGLHLRLSYLLEPAGPVTCRLGSRSHPGSPTAWVQLCHWVGIAAISLLSPLFTPIPPIHLISIYG